jgi:hypothetical protein
MTKILLIILLTINLSHSGDNIPKNKTNFSGHDSFIRLFKKTKLLTFKFDYQNGRRYKEHKSSNLEFGAYYKFSKSQQLGVFFGESNGKRHSNDWTSTNGIWHWRDTSERVERIMNLVYVGKYRFSVLDPTLYILKSSYIINDFNSNNTIIIEPGFHYFSLENQVPVWSLKASFPLYFAINFDKKEMYKKGLYLNLLKHFDKNFAIGINFKYLNEEWDIGEEYKKANPNKEYSSQDISQTIGISLICNL